MVTFGAGAALDGVQAGGAKGDRSSEVVRRLQATADDSQRWVRDFLRRSKADFQPFWIVDAIRVTGSRDLLDPLAARPEVSRVDTVEVIPAPQQAARSTADLLAAASVKWNIDRIGAPKVWATGNTGHGVVVADMSSGVQLDHPALAARYRSDYGWYDPRDHSPAPKDAVGTGTGTTGIMVGGEGIGVAPGARWIAAKACDLDGCAEPDIIAAGQWLVCPTDTDGANPDCSKAPDIVNIGWNSGSGTAFFDDVVRAFHAAGILAFGGIGNNGPQCGTATSPADSTAGVIASGATDESDVLASFSSRGPAADGRVKPDLVAPGAGITTSDHHGGYTTRDGTQFASAHTAGVAALILNARPQIAYAEMLSVLSSGASAPAKGGTSNCGGIDSGTAPNNESGYGLLNAFHSVEATR
ncbi:S8 family serine peptidase [Nocardia sp. NPDC057030]|uniref:S8 family serine peptidase n=1 Tax=unclassified Nocardia TaxID=2637762 RepID=UPI0036384D13